VPFINGQSSKKVPLVNGQIQKKCHLEMDKNKKVPFTNGQTSIFSLEDAVLWTKKKIFCPYFPALYGTLKNKTRKNIFG